MGFTNFLNKLTGGTLSPTQDSGSAAPMQPQAVPDLAVTPSVPVADPTPVSQPEPAVMPSPMTPEATASVTPNETTMTTASDLVMPAANPLPQPTTTDPIPTIPEPVQIEPLPQEMPAPTASAVTDPSMQMPASESTTNTEPAPSLDTLIATVFTALDTLASMTAESSEISEIRKTYEDALTQIGNRHDNAAFTILFELLLTHVEAELYNFSAFQTIADHPSTLEATVSAFAALAKNNPAIIPQEYRPALSEIEMGLQILKNQGKEIEAYDTFTSAYTSSTAS